MLAERIVEEDRHVHVDHTRPSPLSATGGQRADLDLIAQYGTETLKGFILTRKDIAEVEREMKLFMNRLSRLQDVFVATDGETMKTTYRATRRQRRFQVGN